MFMSYDVLMFGVGLEHEEAQGETKQNVKV